MSKIFIEISQLTHYEKRRLNQSRLCPVCGKTICDWDYICMSKVKNRRNMIYSFYHAECIRLLPIEIKEG